MWEMPGMYLTGSPLWLLVIARAVATLDIGWLRWSRRPARVLEGPSTRPNQEIPGHDPVI